MKSTLTIVRGALTSCNLILIDSPIKKEIFRTYYRYPSLRRNSFFTMSSKLGLDGKKKLTLDEFRAIVSNDAVRGLSKQDCISQLVKTYGDNAPSSGTVDDWYDEFKPSKRAGTKSRLNKGGEPAAKIVTRSSTKEERATVRMEEEVDEPVVKRGRTTKPKAAVEKAKNPTSKEEPKLVAKKVRTKKPTKAEEKVEEVVETKTKKSTKTAKKVLDEDQTQENSLEVPKSRGRRAKSSPIVADNELNVSVAAELPTETEERVEAVPKGRGGGRKKSVTIQDAEPAVTKKSKTNKAKPSEKPAVEAKKKRGAKKEAPEADAPTPVEQEAKPAAAKARGRKRAAAEPETENDAEVEVESVELGKPAGTNSTESVYNKADFELSPAAVNGGAGGKETRFNLKVSSWNVAGLRAWLKKDGLKFLDYEEPDIFCMQETKCANDQLPEEVVRIAGYHPYWLCMPGGYAGVAIYSKIMPINVTYGIGHEEFDDVGRMITAEYEKFYLINVYVPNSGRKLVNLDMRMRWEETFQAYAKKLDALKPLVICGDMNVSHLEIDLANPKSNTRNAGFTKEERDQMTKLLELGFVDTFRNLYPTRTAAYTFWTYMSNARARNVGWRLDYFIVSQRFASRVVDNCIRSQCKGSDHCPITLFLKL